MRDDRTLPNVARFSEDLLRESTRSGKREFLAAALLALLTVGLYLPILRRMLSAYDYVYHLEAARKLTETSAVTTPHMLFHALVAGLGRLIAADMATAGTTVLLLCIAATALTVYWLWLRPLPVAQPAKLFMAAALLLVAPVTLLYWADHHLYFGYIGVNVFHNPTILVLKFFSLLLFGLSSYVLADKQSGRWRKLLLLVVPLVVVCCALSKPNYLICFLPALCLFLLGKATMRARIDWGLFLWGILLPSVLVLSLQYYLTYSSSQIQGFYMGESSIVLAPFKVVSLYSGWLLPKFLLSIAFPLSVFLLYPNSASKDSQLVLAWIAFGFGALQTYFFMESGPRYYQGNFWWSGQITLFVLFVASSVHLLKNASTLQFGGLRRVRFSICLGFFLLHLISGIFFYWAEFSQTQRYW